MTWAFLMEELTYYVERFGGMLAFVLFFAAVFYGFEAMLAKFGIYFGKPTKNIPTH
jgi:hypothetical protein